MSFANPSRCPNGRPDCPCQPHVGITVAWIGLVKALGPMPGWPADGPR